MLSSPRLSRFALARLPGVALAGVLCQKGWRIVLLVAILVACGATGARATEPRFVVVVHSSSSESELDREFVADAFLKKRTRWPSGDVIFPVDQRKPTVVRKQFSEEVLRRSVDAIRNYWQQRIFSGRDVPPPEVDSDAEVIRFVQSRPGAIGYVSGEASVTGVRVVTVR